MKKFAKNTVLCASLVAALTACAPEKKADSSKVKLSINAQMQVDELTQAGEQLIAPHTLNLADRAFEMALQKNPNDKKAQFYRAFLKRFMVFRGVLTRIRPIAQQYGNVAQLDQTIKDIPNSPLRDFLTKPADGYGPLNTEESVQDLLIQYRKALLDFRTFVTQNQNLQLDLYINPVLFSEKISQNMQDNCKVVEGKTEEDGEFVCDKTDAATVRVNIADLMAMKQEAAGEILYLTLATSYNLNGLGKLIKENGDRQLSAKESFALLGNVKLTLLADQGMTIIRSLGVDLGSAAQWAVKYQSSICPEKSAGKRKGFLFSEGLCVDQANVAKNVEILGQILKGAMGVKFTDDEGKEIATKTMNFLAPFDHPVKDLHKLTPSTWDDKGEYATGFYDKTLGGLMPNGDADFLLKPTAR